MGSLLTVEAVGSFEVAWGPYGIEEGSGAMENDPTTFIGNSPAHIRCPIPRNKFKMAQFNNAMKDHFFNPAHPGLSLHDS